METPIANWPSEQGKSNCLCENAGRKSGDEKSGFHSLRSLLLNISLSCLPWLCFLCFEGIIKIF
jgi:hypothetical protein